MPYHEHKKINVIRHINSFKNCYEANYMVFNEKQQKRIEKLIYKIGKVINKWNTLERQAEECLKTMTVFKS